LRILTTYANIMFITACNHCGNSPQNSQYTTYVYTQKKPCYQNLHGAIGGSCPVHLPWIRHWRRWWCGFSGGWIHCGHSFYSDPVQSICHATSANVLIPLNEVKYEVDLETVACPPHHERRRWRMDFGMHFSRFRFFELYRWT